VPVLNEVHMSARHELQSDWELDSSSHMSMYVPWYARLIEPQIGIALDKSVREARRGHVEHVRRAGRPGAAASAAAERELRA